MESQLETSTEYQITTWLKENRYTLAWLSREANIDPGYLSRMLNGNGYVKKPLLQKQLDKINKTLGTQFKLTDGIN